MTECEVCKGVSRHDLIFCPSCGADLYEREELAKAELNRAQQLQLDNGIQCVFCKSRTAVRFEEYGRPICQWCTDDHRGRQLAIAHGC